MSVNIFKNGILSKIAGAVGDAVPLINNFLTNQEGKGAADANTVYVLNNKIEEVNNSLAKLKTYSTTEIDTGNKWIDDKSIYRKVITGGSIPASSYINLDIGVNIDTLISASGCCIDFTGISRNMNDSLGVSLTNWKNNKINVSSYSAAISSFTIIIEYTKK